MKKVEKVIHLIFNLISFPSLNIFCNFCCHILALRFSMQGVLLLYLMGVHVDKKPSNLFFILWLIILNFCLHMVHEN